MGVDWQHPPVSGGRARGMQRSLDATHVRRYHMTMTSSSDDAEGRRTRRDLRAALIFGIVAATLEMGALLYFFR
jgi:hypothetical protein